MNLRAPHHFSQPSMTTFTPPLFFWHFLNFSQLTHLTKSISVKKILDSCGEKYQNQDFSHIVLSVSLQRGVKVRSTFFLSSEVKQCSEIITKIYNSLLPFCSHTHATMLKTKETKTSKIFHMLTC